MPDDNHPTDQLTATEQTLVLVLGPRTSILTGALCRAHGWREPTDDEVLEMSRHQIGWLTEIVLGMRHPDMQTPTQEELSATLHGLAYAALEKVMGLRPPPEKPKLTLVN